MQDEFPSISADGSTIAFRWFVDDEYKIFVVNPDGTLTELADFAYQIGGSYHSPSISADGSTIAFSDYSAVFVVNSDGMDLTQVTDNPSSRAIFPSISGDGSTIAFQSTVIGCGWEIFVINPDGSDLTQLTYNTAQDGRPLISADGTKIAFQSIVDGDFEIFVVSYNEIPVADANGPYTGSEGSLIAFDGTGSYDPDGTIVYYEWDFGYGDTATGATPTHAYGDNGEYTVTLRVTDDDGGVGTDTSIVTVDNVAPTASIDSVEQPNAYFILPYHELTFIGSFTDPGWLDTPTIVWDFGDLVTATGALTPTHAYSLNGVYLVTLTVTDDDGGIGTDNIEITILSEKEAITTVDDNIQDLPDDAFKINPDQRKNALSEKLDEVNGLIEAGEYQEAIEKLQNDIRAKADGYVDGNPVNDWIIDPDEQQERCMMVDDLIAYLETLL